MSHFLSLYGEQLGLSAAAITGIGWLVRYIVKRFEQMEAKLDACEQREDDAQNRRAKMWRIIDMLLDAIEDIEPQPRKLDRVRGLLAELREDETKLTLEPAE